MDCGPWRKGNCRTRTGGWREKQGMKNRVAKSESEWEQQLTPEQFRVMRQKGTERAFTGRYVHSKQEGVYQCAGCGAALFSSDAKFDSGTGWPSFWAPVSGEAVDTETDRSLGMERTEVLCGTCGAHLGHLFEDGPPPTNLRYCINSVTLNLAEKGGAA
jgi:peptide-methionine (R)-S-oxide reductase